MARNDHVSRVCDCPNRPMLGVDTTSADGRSFEVDGAYWEQQVSDYMIRGVVVLR